MKYIILLLLVISIDCNSQNRAVIKGTGKEVNLFDDGTWKYVIEEPEGVLKTDTLVYNRSKESNNLVKSSKLNYGIWMNNKKWSYKKGEDGLQEFNFTLVGQDAYGIIISERVEIPIDNLLDIALQNAEKAAPDIKVIKKECRRINGKIVHFMQMEGTLQGIKFVYLGYYYSDSNGSIQFLTYTSQNLLKQYRNEMETLLNGFVVNL